MKIDLYEMRGTILNLVIFCLIAGFLLAAVNELTRGKILANEQKSDAEARKMLLAADKYVNLPGIPGVVKGVKNNKLVGYVAKTESSGYSGKIVMMYSFTPDFKIIAVKIISQTETPGLGTKILENVNIPQFGNKPFLSQFAGKSESQLAIGQSKTFSDSNIAAITGATISSRAVTKGIRESLSDLMQKIKNIR